jgi:maleate isomerase
VIRIGVLTPHLAIGPEEEFPAMAAGRIVTHVARVPADAAAADAAAAGAGTSGPAPEALRALTAPPVIDDAAADLAAGPVDVIGYASASSGYAIGFDGEAALAARLARRTGVAVAATCASAVLALRVLGVERMALVDPPWFDGELNELGAAYFRSQGLQVVSVASAGLSRDPGLIESAAVVEWTSRHVPDDAQAVFIAGNGFRAAGAIEALELMIGRPDLTSNQVLLWHLLGQAGATFEVREYGQLFTHDPLPRR